VRKEESGDKAGIFQVLLQAFQKDGEAKLVDALREDNNAWIPNLSLVALDTATKQIVGHILFTLAHVLTPDQTNAPAKPILALAPLAVLPTYQRQGVGSTLIKKGLEIAREMAQQVRFTSPLAFIVLLMHFLFSKPFLRSL